RGRYDGPVLPGSKPREMAFGAHHLVLRDIPSATLHAQLPGVSSGFSMALQQLLQISRRTSGKAASQLLLTSPAAADSGVPASRRKRHNAIVGRGCIRGDTW